MKDPRITPSRGPPKKVEDIVHEGVRYSAPLGKMGFIEARDVNTNEFLWDLKVYEVEYLPTLERDIQEVYIVSFELKSEGLEIINERNEKYFVDLKTK
ncbi:MAG: hypothetical protein EU542_08320, partial [Promethearchaeota archaeon]